MQKNGFILIEVVIYILLYSIMIGGILITVFQLIQNSESRTRKDKSVEETNFVLQKINWALGDTFEVKHPIMDQADYLEINKENFIDNPIIFRLNTQDINFNFIEICLSGDCYPLTSKNIKINELSFTYLPKKGHSSPGIKTKIIINDFEITSIKYLKNE
jgi:type II secretory pathway pseudopilin PulG